MSHYLYARDLVSDVTSAPDTFTSWDKCMSKSYCKWPVIVGIVVGSLILLSVLWCLVRCLCCGAEICACCCSCCSSGRKRARPSKHADDYTRMPPAPYAGYQPAPAPMAYGNPNVPQFATFDSPSTKINEDSLPAMPSWDSATTKKVEDAIEVPHPAANGDLEMGRLETQPQRMRGGYNSLPNGPISPVSPNPQGDYFANPATTHSYNADLGAQRISPNGQGYDDFQSVALSPPPTYRSNSYARSASSNHFAPGAASPSPTEYNNAQQRQQQPYEYHHQSAYAPSSVSTRYEPSQNDYSSNRIRAASPYSGQPEYQPGYQARPPSFLQVGRKPVSGSFREV